MLPIVKHLDGIDLCKSGFTAVVKVTMVNEFVPQVAEPAFYTASS
jgi:hypothetical protein